MIPDKERFDVSLQDLQTFLSVAELGSFSRAADRLSLSQPSVSNRVRRLEEKLGVRLLERTTRKVELTPDGSRLHGRASITLRSLRDLLQDFHVEVGLSRRQVDVVATMTVATIALPSMLGAFAEAEPDITVRLRDRLPASALADVLEARADLAIMVAAELPAGLEFEPLIADRCVAVVSLGHPLLIKPAATLADILVHPILSADGHVALRDAIVAASKERGLSLRLAAPALGISNVLTLLAMAAAGLGVCIHPRSLIPIEFGPTVGVVEIEDCEIVRTFGIVTPSGRRLSQPAKVFVDYLRRATSSDGANWGSRLLFSTSERADA